MARLILALFVGLGLSPAVSASPALLAKPDADTLNKACYAKVGPLLRSADGKLSPAVRNAYLEWAEKTVRQQLRRNNQAVPESCLAAVRQHDTLRVAIFGSVFPPDPSILQNYAQLCSQLDGDFLHKYRSMAVAVAVARRIKGVETSAQCKRIGRDYQPEFWTDESLQVPAPGAEKDYISRIADFMRQSQTSAADLYNSDTLQAQLRVDLAQHGVNANFINEVNKSVHFGERLKYAMVLLGERPAAREAKPDAAVWLRHLAAINDTTHISTPMVNGQPMPWPLFPIEKSPWPLLMPLAHAIPVSEANYIWDAFQGEYGSDRYHTYGPYRGDDEVMPDSLRPSRWFWDAWPDRIVHGGACVPISKGTVDLYSALGKPAMWAGQPGHANLISFQNVNGAWTAEVEQAFAGGPDVTCAQWYFDEDEGTMLHFRDLYYWPGAEYHLGIALGMNIGLKSYMDTRIAANIFRTMPAAEKGTVGIKLLRGALLANPYNPDIWYRLAQQTSDPLQGVALAEAALKGDAGLLSNGAGNVPPQNPGAGPANIQYWETLAQVVTQYAILSHPAPRDEETRRRVYNVLKSVHNPNAGELAAYVEQFVDNSGPDSGAKALEYDQSLAEQGDPFGRLRMSQRYRDGDGVPFSDTKQRELLTSSAGQGDVVAATILGSVNPVIPADQITVTASSVYSEVQLASHLVDGAGMMGAAHDNHGAAATMWHTVDRPTARPPAKRLPASPAWVRFNFTRPTAFESIQIWNHNQANLTNRGFRNIRIYGSSDGLTWIPLTAHRVITLPCASGMPFSLPVTIQNEAESEPLTAVIIAAEEEGGNFGGSCYGLSAVRFVLPHLSHVIPARAISVSVSSVYSFTQAPEHLIDGSGMLGALHDNHVSAQTMWHTVNRPAAQPPVIGLPPSPAWARFDFTRPMSFDSLLIWNHNQLNLTDRGFRKVRIYGCSDGTTWRPLTASETIELPRATGAPLAEATSVSNHLAADTFKSVIIAADEVDGNYGGDCYGLSAVRFVVR